MGERATEDTQYGTPMDMLENLLSYIEYKLNSSVHHGDRGNVVARPHRQGCPRVLGRSRATVPSGCTFSWWADRLRPGDAAAHTAHAKSEGLLLQRSLRFSQPHTQNVMMVRVRESRVTFDGGLVEASGSAWGEEAMTNRDLVCALPSCFIDAQSAQLRQIGRCP